MHVLRDLCEGLAPDGQVVDLQAIEPSGRVEVDGQELGRIDDTLFFKRARPAVAGLDALVEDGVLTAERQIEFDALVRYDTGPELIAAIADSDERALGTTLASQLANVGRCVVRERSLVRVFSRSGQTGPSRR